MYAANTGTFLQRDPLGDSGPAALEYSHEAVTHMLTAKSQSRAMSPMSSWPMQHERGSLVGFNLYEYVISNPLRFTDPLGLAPEPGFWTGYWHYLWNPGQMDSDLQSYQQAALTTAVVAGAGAGGLAYASYAGISQIGAVGLASLPAQAAIEIYLVRGAAVTLTATCASHVERVFQNSNAFISWIVRGSPGRPDPGGFPGALRWDVPGTFNGRQGMFELVMDSSGRVIHFLFTGN